MPSAALCTPCGRLAVADACQLAGNSCSVVLRIRVQLVQHGSPQALSLRVRLWSTAANSRRFRWGASGRILCAAPAPPSNVNARHL